MRVMVTGGAGFIGSHIIDELLARGHEPVAVDNLASGRRENLPAGVPLFVVDICDAAALARVFDEFQPEWVCHQAAQMSVSRSVREPAFDAEVNVLGLVRVFDNALRVNAQRVVFASSGGVLYGDVVEPADENHPAAPISPYGISKWVGEKYLEFYVREHGLRGVALRYANVYGPRQNPHGEAGVVAIFSQKMLAAEQATIFGDGEHIRDYVYAGDVARANVLSLEAEFQEGFVALNIGTGLPTTTNELAEHIHELAEATRQQQGLSGAVPAARHGDPRAGDLRSSLVSAKKASDVLGWRPTVDVADGLRRTVEWFAAQNPPRKQGTP